MDAQVESGAIFYHALRRRHEVIFDRELRRRTAEVVDGIPGCSAATAAGSPQRRAVPQLLADKRMYAKVLGEPARLRGLQGALFHPLPVLADSGD